MPAFNNDEIIIPSFISKVFLVIEDAYDYSAIGCVETAVPGNGYRCTGMSYMNFPKVLLITDEWFESILLLASAIPSFGHFKDMKSFDELQTAWDKTSAPLNLHVEDRRKLYRPISEREVPDNFLFSFTDDCIGRGNT